MIKIKRAPSGHPVLSKAAILIASIFCADQSVLASVDGTSGIDWSELPTTEQTLTNSPLSITEAGTHVLSGDSNAGIIVDTEGKVRLVLNGVKIAAEDGAAINIENADDAVIYLAEGSENYLEDAAIRADESIDAAIHSSDDLYFEGPGSLTVLGNFADGIVSNDDLVFSSGTYIVKSADDGIRGKDSLWIYGGEISVIAEDDGIKSTNESDPDKGNLHILNGLITVDAQDDAIKAVNSIVVDGGEINVTRSLEGMEASNISLNAGKVMIVAKDDGINAVRIGSNSDVFIAVNGGEIDVTVDSGDTDAFDSNGSISITGGNINVTAPTSAFDYDRGAEMTGGALVINGELSETIPASRRGGGRGDRGNRDGGFWGRGSDR